MTRQRSELGPENQFGSVPNPSKNGNCFVLAGLIPRPDINPRFLARFIIEQSLIFVNSDVWLQLPVSVLIILQYDIYIKAAVLDARSPPSLQFVI